MNHFVRDTLIAARPAPADPVPALIRWRRLCFGGVASTVFTLVLAGVAAVVLWDLALWALVHAQWRGSSSQVCADGRGACWAFVGARWKPLLVGDYPADQLWRAWTCFALFAVFWTWVVRRSHQAGVQRVLVGFIALPIVLFVLLLGGAPATRWGGLLLTLMVSLATFATALPLGLLLALGRRSRLPVLRACCAAFVEGMRSVPLLVVLFIAAALLPLFLPRGWNVDLFSRALAAFVLFNAALAAEVFRGGLQSVGSGQSEAAATLGLGDAAALALVVLPQAIAVVVPALVNIMIGVIKETTLMSVIGLNDLLGAVENGAKSPDWMGEANILSSGQVFLALAYFLVCFSLSRYSRRLEARR